MSTTTPIGSGLERKTISGRCTAAACYLICVLGVVALAGLLLAPKFLFPAEDAVILFQFSKNLAHTGAITFVQHGPHTEGATDFGWMVLISLGIKLGIEPVWFVAIANAASILIFAILLVKLAGCRVRLFPVFFIVGCMCAMPQYFASLVAFSSLPFACLLALLAIAYLRRKYIALPILALLLCLFRPDGIIFALPLLISALALYPQRLRRLTLDLLLLVLPGSVYFLWRWHYFAEFLPLPFLVKSNAQRIAHLFVFDSLKFGAHYLIFSWLLVAFALRKHLREEGNRPLFFCLLLLPNLFYFAMRLDQNIGDRFFIYMPVGTAIVVASNWTRIRMRPQVLWVALALWAIAIVRPFMYQEGILERYQMDNRIAIAQDLGHLPRGTMVVTEAGILPYFSNWDAYDAWGLNSAEFAKRLFQPADVSKIRPDLMLVYTGGDSACFPAPGWQVPYTVRTWDNLTRNMISGADLANYELWLVPFGSSSYRRRHAIGPHDGDQECWFLRPASPLYSRVKDVLVRHHGLSAAEYGGLHPALVNR